LSLKGQIQPAEQGNPSSNAELFVSPAESHLLWFSSYNAAIEEKMRAFLQASRVLG
jgi:hypothetical protein